MSDPKIDIQTLASSDKGSFSLNEPQEDDLDKARHCFKKGRLEFMGGPVYFEQGQDYTYDQMNQKTFQMEKVTLTDNNRKRVPTYPMAANIDPIALELEVDATEQ